MRVRRAGVDLLAADVREDALAVARVRFDQPMHLRQGVGDALLVRVVEGEAHSEDDAPLEALAGVRFKTCRVGVAALVEQECGDVLHIRIIEHLGSCKFALGDVQNADHHGRVAGPVDPLGGAVDLATVFANPAQAGGAGITLGDGVGGNQTERATFAQQVERTPVEMRDQVGVAVAPSVDGLEPIGVADDVTGGEVVLPRERRVPDERVEPRILPLEHFRELDLPMKWGKRQVSVTLVVDPSQVADGLTLQHGCGEFETLPFPWSRLGFSEERRQRQITVEPDGVKLVACVLPNVVEFPIGDILARVPDAPTQPG